MLRQLTIALVLAASCLAQTNVNLPTIVDSITGEASNGGSATTISKYVTSGDMLVGLARGSLPTITDTCSTSFSNVDFTYDETSIGRGGPYPVRMFYGVAACSGLDTVTGSVPLGSVNEWGLTELTSGLTFDASGITTAVLGTTLTPTATSTVNGDIGIAGFVNSVDKNGQPITPSQIAYDMDAGGDTNHLMAWANFGAAGSQSISYTPLQSPSFAGNFDGGAAIILFKHALAVATTLLPNCDKTQACAMTLQAVGGTGSYTWTVQTGTLPTGLSLNASTGAITGTVSGAVGNYPIVFRVTESGGGTHADSSGLFINVGATFGTPTIVQSAFSAPQASNLAYSSNVSSGHTLLVLFKGTVRHGSEGFVLPQSGSGGGITDSLGTVWTRGAPINPAGTVPIVPYIGCATNSGPDTVTFTDNQSQGSGEAIALLELSSTQHVFDLGVFGTFFGRATSPFTITTPSYTIPVNNMALFSSGNAELNGGGGGTTTTPSAPFSLLGVAAPACTFSCFDVSIDFGVAAGTITASATVTSSFPNDTNGSEIIFGLRPDISSIACGGTPVATTQVRHKVVLF